MRRVKLQLHRIRVNRLVQDIHVSGSQSSTFDALSSVKGFPKASFGTTVVFTLYKKWFRDCFNMVHQEVHHNMDSILRQVRLHHPHRSTKGMEGEGDHPIMEADYPMVVAQPLPDMGDWEVSKAHQLVLVQRWSLMNHLSTKQRI